MNLKTPLTAVVMTGPADVAVHGQTLCSPGPPLGAGDVIAVCAHAGHPPSTQLNPGGSAGSGSQKSVARASWITIAASR